jgi:hypothetical protein
VAEEVAEIALVGLVEAVVVEPAVEEIHQTDRQDHQIQVAVVVAHEEGPA